MTVEPITGSEGYAGRVHLATVSGGVYVSLEELRSLVDAAEEILGVVRPERLGPQVVAGTATVKITPEIDEGAFREAFVKGSRKAAYDTALSLTPYDSDPRAVIEVARFLIGED